MIKRIMLAGVLIASVGSEVSARSIARRLEKLKTSNSSSASARRSTATPVVLTTPTPVILTPRVEEPTKKVFVPRQKPAVLQKKTVAKPGFFKRNLGKITAAVLAVAGYGLVDHYGVPSFIGIDRKTTIDGYVKNECTKKAFTFVKNLFVSKA